jgi:hypothetical protein
LYYLHFVGHGLAGEWTVVAGGDGSPAPAIDCFRTHSSAEHAAALLNSGRARIEPHRLLGCRVQPVYADRPQQASV